MHHDFLDRFSRIDSPIHRLPASVKAAAALCIVGLVVLSPIAWVYPFAAVSILLIVIALTSKIPAGFIVRRLLFFEPFVIVIAIVALLQPDGAVRFTSIIVKSTLSLITVILLSNTTPFDAMLALLTHLPAPRILVTTLALMYRYTFILVDEMERILRARQSRTFLKSTSRSWFILSTVLGQLFVRSTERAERIYAAMCARGWK